MSVRERLDEEFRSQALLVERHRFARVAVEVEVWLEASHAIVSERDECRRNSTRSKTAGRRRIARRKGGQDANYATAS